MSDPSKKPPPNPDATLVDSDEEASSSPTPLEAFQPPMQLGKPLPSQVPTLPLNPVATPVGKRPTSGQLPAQRDPNATITSSPNNRATGSTSGQKPAATITSSPSNESVGRRPTGTALPTQKLPEVPTLPPEPGTVVDRPERKRASGRRPVPSGTFNERPTDPPTMDPHAAPTRPPLDVAPALTPLERPRHNVPPPAASPRPSIGGGTQETPVRQLPPGASPDNANTVQVVQAFDPDTRLNPMPAKKVVGPSGTLDTEPSNAGVSSEPSPNSFPPLPPEAPTGAMPPVPSSTHDYKPAYRTTGQSELHERGLRWALAALVAGATAVGVLLVVWLFVKFEEPPPDVGQASPIVPKSGQKPDAKLTPVPVEAPRALTIDQVVDAGNGETRTIQAAAGTVRIVTDPDCYVTVDGRELGMAPVLVTLPAGKNQVLLENKKLFFRRTVTVDVTANEQTAVRFAFSQGWIELDAPKGAKVTVDGRPATGTHVQVWEGPHKVEVTFADKKKTRAVKMAEVAAGMTTSVHFEAPSIADD